MLWRFPDVQLFTSSRPFEGEIQKPPGFGLFVLKGIFPAPLKGFSILISRRKTLITPHPKPSVRFLMRNVLGSYQLLCPRNI